MFAGGTAMAKGDKREKILQVAEKMFATRRFHEVTLDEIAALAHIGKGTIYLYFKSKDDLLFQLIITLLKTQEEQLSAVAASDKPVREKLSSFIEEMGTFFQQHHMALHQFHNPEMERSKPQAGRFMRDHHDRITKLARKIIREGFDENVISPIIDLDAATCIFISMVHGRDMWFLDNGREIDTKTLVNLFIQGVGKPS
jgi:AcrR family transcriptional regulator